MQETDTFVHSGYKHCKRRDTFVQSNLFVEVDFFIAIIIVITQAMAVVRGMDGGVRLRESMKPDLYVCNYVN